MGWTGPAKQKEDPAGSYFRSTAREPKSFHAECQKRPPAMEEDEFMSAGMMMRRDRLLPTPWGAPITTIFGTLMTSDKTNAQHRNTGRCWFHDPRGSANEWVAHDLSSKMIFRVS